MTDMEMQMIRALAAIDDELGMPQDGCNSTDKTLTAIRLLNVIYKDDQKHIAELEQEVSALRAELDKPEPFKPDWAGYRQGKDDALAEFSQVPVAWMNRSDEILPTFHRTKEAASFWGDNPVPLYTKEQP